MADRIRTSGRQRVSTNDPLAYPRFSYQTTRQGMVQISFEGRIVTRLAGRQAQRFLDRVEHQPPREQQLEMAKATGHFKHGNERTADRGDQ